MLTPFEWGVSDCTMFAETVRVMTGFDPISDGRGYTSELSAIRNLRAVGYETMLCLIEDRFQGIQPEMAARGDLGFPAEISHPLMSPAVIDGAYAYSKGPEGAVIMPRSIIVRAYAV